jgi:hypothetical protein
VVPAYGILTTSAWFGVARLHAKSSGFVGGDGPDGPTRALAVPLGYSAPCARCGT